MLYQFFQSVQQGGSQTPLVYGYGTATTGRKLLLFVVFDALIKNQSEIFEPRGRLLANPKERWFDKEEAKVEFFLLCENVENN